LEEIDRRARDVSAQLTQRIGEVDAQEEVIARTLRDARRIIDVLSGLETRIANLTGTDQILDGAGAYIGGLERRAAAAVAQLEETTSLKHKVDQELAQLRRHLKDLTETTRHETRKRFEDWKKLYARRLHPVRAGVRPSVTAKGRAVVDWWSQI